MLSTWILPMSHIRFYPLFFRDPNWNVLTSWCPQFCVVVLDGIQIRNTVVDVHAYLVNLKVLLDRTHKNCFVYPINFVIQSICGGHRVLPWTIRLSAQLFHFYTILLRLGRKTSNNPAFHLPQCKLVWKHYLRAKQVDKHFHFSCSLALHLHSPHDAEYTLLLKLPEIILNKFPAPVVVLVIVYFPALQLWNAHVEKLHQFPGQELVSVTYFLVLTWGVTNSSESIKHQLLLMKSLDNIIESDFANMLFLGKVELLAIAFSTDWIS